MDLRHFPLLAATKPLGVKNCGALYLSLPTQERTLKVYWDENRKWRL